METFLFFRLRFRRTYDSAYDSDFRFSPGHKLSYDSDYDSDSDSVASENQPLRKRLKRENVPVFKLLFEMEFISARQTTFRFYQRIVCVM